MALNVTDNAKKGNNNKETVRVSAMIRPPPANNGGATQLRRSAIGLLHRNTLKRGQMQNQEKRNGEFGLFGETAMGIENPLFIAANPTFGRWARTKGDERKVSSSSTNEK